MPSLRNLLPIAACVAAAAVASAQTTEAQKKARADFLKQREKKTTSKTVEPPLPVKKAEPVKKKPAEPSRVAQPKKAEKVDEKKPVTTAAKPADSKPVGEKPKPQAKLSLPLPKGQDSKGVVIPYTDATGKKSMVFKIGVGRRLDDENVNMNDLLIEMYDDQGAQEMTVALPAAQMNLGTRVIGGQETVTIKRSDFQLTGQTMEFNTETRQGWIKGNVKMIIYDLTEETGSAAPKKEGQGS